MLYDTNPTISYCTILAWCTFAPFLPILKYGIVQYWPGRIFAPCLPNPTTLFYYDISLAHICAISTYSYLATTSKAMCKELGRLAQGYGEVGCTDTIHFMSLDKIAKIQRIEL